MNDQRVVKLGRRWVDKWESKRQNNTERFKVPRVEAGCLGEVEQEAD